MIAPRCSSCGHELIQFGGILLGPPDPVERVRKDHLCVSCYGFAEILAGLLAALDLLWGHMPAQQVQELREDVPETVELCMQVHEHLWHRDDPT